MSGPLVFCLTLGAFLLLVRIFASLLADAYVVLCVKESYIWTKMSLPVFFVRVLNCKTDKNCTRHSDLYPFLTRIYLAANCNYKFKKIMNLIKFTFSEWKSVIFTYLRHRSFGMLGVLLFTISDGNTSHCYPRCCYFCVGILSSSNGCAVRPKCFDNASVSRSFNSKKFVSQVVFPFTFYIMNLTYGKIVH